MALERISDIVLQIFVSISVPIYIVFIITVLVNRSKSPFQSPFFTLCLSLGVGDIITVFHSYLFVRSAGWGWFENFWLTNGGRGSLLALLSNAFMFGMVVNQHLGVLFMSLNRLTAVVFSMKHKNLWSTRNTAIAIALQWILPIVFVSPMYLSEFEYAYYISKGVTNNHSFSVKFCDQDYETVYYLSSFIINMFVNVTTCAMYIAVFIRAAKHTSQHAAIASRFPAPSSGISDGSRKGTKQMPSGLLQQKSNVLQASASKAKAHSQTTRNHRELRLAVSGFLLFISMFMYFLFLVLILIIGDPDFDGGLMYPIVCDIFSCINPYALLLLSKQTRISFVHTLQCKKSS